MGVDCSVYTGKSSVVVEGTFRFYCNGGKKSFIMFMESPVVGELQVPIKSVLQWSMVTGGVGSGLTLGDLEEGDDIEIRIPRWLAKREDLVP